MTEISASDSLGPEKIVHVRNPRIGLDAILVVDNVATGPSIGGIRMAPDVTLEECRRLARAMTLKNAAAELPHGGGKSVIRSEPGLPEAQKARLIRAFACAIDGISDYIPGPDMGTDETAMAWIRDEIGRSVGLPRLLGGIPLDEIGATGHGLAVAIEAAQDFSGVVGKELPGPVDLALAFGQRLAFLAAEQGAEFLGPRHQFAPDHVKAGLAGFKPHRPARRQCGAGYGHRIIQLGGTGLGVVPDRVG